MTARDVDDMEDIIDDLLMRRKSGKYIAQTLVNCGFGRLPAPMASAEGCGPMTAEQAKAIVRLEAEVRQALEHLGEVVGASIRKRNARVITTREELDALPVGSIVLHEQYQEVAIRVQAKQATYWRVTGDGGLRETWYLVHEYGLPFTLLR